MSEPGQAIVTGSINEDGVVVGAAPISLPASEGPYRETAIYAFSLWRYAPAMQGGGPTSVVWTLTVNYRME